jgi:hypothetical protein
MYTNDNSQSNLEFWVTPHSASVPVLGPYVQQADLENGVVGAKKGYAAVQESWGESSLT